MKVQTLVHKRSVLNSVLAQLDLVCTTSHPTSIRSILILLCHESKENETLQSINSFATLRDAY